MAGRNALAGTLEELAGLKVRPLTKDTAARLKKHIRGGQALVAGKAAKIAAGFQMAELLPDMESAMDRLLSKPASDKGCNGIILLAEALNLSGTTNFELIKRMSGHIQFEPVYGGQKDSAARLRGLAACCLANCSEPERYYEFARLSQDDEPEVRLMTIETLGELPGMNSELLLLQKACQSGENQRIVGAAAGALLKLNFERFRDFVKERLQNAQEDFFTETIFSMGEGNRQEPLNLLMELYNFEVLEVRKNEILRALCLSRNDTVRKFILSLVAGEKISRVELILREWARLERLGDEEVLAAVRSAPSPEVYGVYLELTGKD